eukprot:7299815-Alexandrium_andersonii.AAC.1
MSASLVGSEMCIRDRVSGIGETVADPEGEREAWAARFKAISATRGSVACLLYTSDAADDM